MVVMLARHDCERSVTPARNLGPAQQKGGSPEGALWQALVAGGILAGPPCQKTLAIATRDLLRGS